MREIANISIGLQHSLLNHLWQSTGILFLVWGLTLCLSKQRASIRYVLWFFASAKFLVPFSLLMELGNALRPATIDSAKTFLAPMNDVIIRSVQPYAASFHTSPAAPTANRLMFPITEAIWALFLVVWALGTVVLIASWTRSWLKLYRVQRNGRPWREVSGIPILVCKNTIDPGVFGVFKPVILFPEIFLRHLPEAELTSICSHELCHVRRVDNLTAFIHAVVHALFWFHPGVWLIRKRLLDERERACDEAVLASGVDTEVYAHSILNICKLQVHISDGVMAGASGGDLRKRIQRILSDHSAEALNLGQRSLLVAAIISIVVIPVLAGAMEIRPAHGDSVSATGTSFLQTAGIPPDIQRVASDALAFDVASVRPSKETKSSSNVPLGPGSVYSQSHGILRANNFPVLTYLVFAYKLTDYQQEAIQSAAPGWVVSDRYSIEARTDKQDVTKDELRSMMRTLLAERFKLAVHYENQRVRVFALVTAKTGEFGPKLRPHRIGSSCSSATLKSTMADGRSMDLPLQPEKGGFPVVCNGILGLPASAEDRYSFGASDVPMKLIASALSSWGNLGRPVVDQTGLSGNYDFVMDYTPDPRPSYATVDSDGPGFQEALKTQLGLKLETERAPVEFLVLDHIERPDPN